MREFSVAVPERKLAAIAESVACFSWETMHQVAGWGAGASSAFMRQLADYWTQTYD